MSSMQPGFILHSAAFSLELGQTAQGFQQCYIERRKDDPFRNFASTVKNKLGFVFILSSRFLTLQ